MKYKTHINLEEYNDKMKKVFFMLNNFEYCKKASKQWGNNTKMFDRNWEIVKEYFATDMTYKEVAKIYGVTAERIRQIIGKYLRMTKVIIRRLENDKKTITK